MQPVPADPIPDTIPENFLHFKHKYRVTTGDNKISLNQKSHLEIKESTDVRKCLAYCIDIMFNKEIPHVRLSSVSNNMDRCIMVAELLKRKVKNLHQVNTFQILSYKQVFTPTVKEKGFEKFELQKSKTVLHILLSRQGPSNKTQAGYQKPIGIELVSKKDPRDYMNRVLDETLQVKKKKIMSEVRDMYLYSDSESEIYDDYYAHNGQRNQNSGQSSQNNVYRRPVNQRDDFYSNERQEKPKSGVNKQDIQSSHYKNKEKEEVVYREKVDELKTEKTDDQQTKVKKSGPRVKWENMPDEVDKEGNAMDGISPEKELKTALMKEKRKENYRMKIKKGGDEDLDTTLYPIQVNDFEGGKGKDNTERIRKQKEAEFENEEKSDNILGELSEQIQMKKSQENGEVGEVKNEGKAEINTENEHQIEKNNAEHHDPESFVDNKTEEKKSFDKEEIDNVRKS